MGLLLLQKSAVLYLNFESEATDAAVLFPY